jgi:hypothetical protein
MSLRDDRTLTVAATVARWIGEEGGRAAVIGAVAMAVHGHVRATRDLDLATELDPFTQLRTVANRARDAGYRAEIALPDAEDPLGGVVTIEGDDFEPVQVVNFYNPHRVRPHPATQAIDAAVELLGAPGLRVVTLEDLVLLKLYAGGLKSLADVEALLAANPETDLELLRRQAGALGLEGELDRIRLHA